MTKNATVWTKKGSQECLAALKALKALGYTVEEKALKSKADIDAFKAAYPNVKTVPLIVVDETVVGGLESIGGLPEAMAAKAAKAAKSSAQNPHTTRAERLAAKKASVAAKKAETLTDPRAARKAAWATNPNNIIGNPIGTREERHAAKQAKTQATLARRAAAQPVPPMAPQGYQIGAPRTATVEQKAARYEENKAKRIATEAARREATAESRNAYRAAEKARIAAATEARKASLA